MMKRTAVVVLALLAAAGCASTQTDDDREPITVVQPVADPKVQQTVNEMQMQLTELLERLDVMNQRLARLEEPPVPARAATPATATTTAPAPAQTITPVEEAPASPAPQQPQRALVGAKLAEDYRQAIILFGRGRHADARRAFQAVFDADPSGDLADNALFWIGETYYAAGDYTNALRHYARVVNEYSEQNKAPDALFKTALAQEKTGDLALARRTLQQVIERYPYSSTASSAKAELQRIRY
jgi:tol-pal system protein YbgF